jgi:hypothetical protein
VFDRERQPAPSPRRAESQADEIAREVGLGGARPGPEALLRSAREQLATPPRPASDRAARDETGRRLGRDLAGVRVVPESPEAERAGSLAFAEHDAVHLAPGAYRPDLPLGRALLAHELTHVAQTGNAPLAGALDAHERAHGAVPVAQPRGLRLHFCGGSGGKKDAGTTVPGATKGAVFAGAHDKPAGAVKHFTGEQVDAFLAASAALGPYVKAPRAAGKVAAGRVHFYSSKDFVEAWVKYALTKNNPATGATFTEAEARAWVPRAFTADDGDIHVDESAGEPRTVVHESIHFYQHDDFTRLGWHVSEGFTELFAQKVIAEQKIVSGANPALADDLAAARKLSAAVSFDAVAKAYFAGDVAGLRAAVDAAKGAGTFDKWLGYMTKIPPDHAAANALF